MFYFSLASPIYTTVIKSIRNSGIKQKGINLLVNIYCISFKVNSSDCNARLPTFLPIIKTCHKFVFVKSLQSSKRIPIYRINGRKMVITKRKFQPWKKRKSHTSPHQVNTEYLLNVWLKTYGWNCNVKRRIIVVQNPSVFSPHFRPFTTNSSTTMAQNTQIIFLLDCLASC